MTIGGITSAGSGVQRGAGLAPQADSVSRNLQNQIAQAQKELRDLSSNENMTAEEKTKKKQEIQQEIADLNQQLRQHQMEQKREQQSVRKAAAEGKENAEGAKSGGGKTGRAKPGGKAEGLSQASMRSMLSADSSMKQAQVQGGVATRMEGRAGVLKAEIKQDAGGNTQAKEAELAETEQKAIDAKLSQISTLASANQEMKEASEAEQGSRTEADGKKVASTEGKGETEAGSRLDPADSSRAESAEGSEDVSDNASDNESDNANGGTAAQETSKNNAYVHVDIRL